LRKKIEAVPSQPKYLLTEPWVGYRFATSEGKPE
jgi:two-component system KDP operon response regulator KdpE